MKRLSAVAAMLCLFVAAPAFAQGARGKARDASPDQDPFAALFQAIKKMGPDSGRDERLYPFIRARTDAGQYEEALEAALLIEDTGMKVATLSRLANGMAETGKLDKAAETLTHALTIIEDEVW